MHSNPPYIDFHTHRRREEGRALEIVSCHPQRNTSNSYFTIGFHPWWTMTSLDSDQILLLKDSFLNDHFCLGIGECGLDKLKGPEASIQEEIFCRQIQLANELNAPVVIHCVRQYHALLHLHKSLARTPWVIHGFYRNKILAKSVLDQGILLSVSPHDKMNISFLQTLDYIPLDRMFLETDSETSHNIMERYAIFTQIRKLNLTEVKSQLYENFINFYSQKWQHQNG